MNKVIDINLFENDEIGKSFKNIILRGINEFEQFTEVAR